MTGNERNRADHGEAMEMDAGRRQRMRAGIRSVNVAQGQDRVDYYQRMPRGSVASSMGQPHASGPA